MFAWLVADSLDYPYLKILSRAVLLFAALGLIPLWRSAGLSARAIGLTPMRVRDALAGRDLEVREPFSIATGGTAAPTRTSAATTSRD